MSLNIVITMAGRGSRFFDAGYVVPKYEIIANGRSLFDWSMLSLKNFISLDAKVIFICLKENGSSDYLQRRCRVLNVRDFHIIELDEITDGQATSAYAARQYWIPEAPLLIYNIDTYVNPHALKPDDISEGSQGWIPCFNGVGSHWSFVQLDDSGWVTDIAEKRRISDYATIGLYWFLSAEIYEYSYMNYFADNRNLVCGERYIAPLYRQMISEGKKVSIKVLQSNDVHVLGTPAELEAFLALSRMF